MLVTVQLSAHACGNTFSGEPDAGKSACPVRRGESGSHRKVSPSLLLYREILFSASAILVVYDTGQRRAASSPFPCHPATGPVLILTSSESERTPAAKSAGFFCCAR